MRIAALLLTIIGLGALASVASGSAADAMGALPPAPPPPAEGPGPRAGYCVNDTDKRLYAGPSSRLRGQQARPSAE